MQNRYLPTLPLLQLTYLLINNYFIMKKESIMKFVAGVGMFALAIVVAKVALTQLNKVSPSIFPAA